MATEDKSAELENILGDLSPEPVEPVRQIALWGVSGDDVEDPAEASAKLTDKAKRNIAVLARQLYMQDLEITGRAVYELWPMRKTTDDIVLTLRAGPRPAVHIIEQFMLTEAYLDLMHELEVPLTVDAQGLTAKQMAVLTTLVAVDDNKTLKQKLSKHRVSSYTFQMWMKQRPFAEAYKKLAEDALVDIIPTALTQLNNRVAAGDMKATEMALAMTGRYDPANKRQIDAVKLVGVILDVIDSEVKDNDTRARIGDRLKILGGKALEM